MPTSTQFDAELGFVVTTYSGVIDAPQLLNTVQAALQQGLQHKCFLFLTDCTALQSGHTLFDLYEAAGQIIAQQPPPQTKEAVLMALNSGLEDRFHFWESVCQNRGFNSRIFTDRATALRWLRE